MTVKKKVEPKSMDHISGMIQNALVELDLEAVSMEQKWGIGVLIMLVPTPMAEKFNRALERLNEAINASDYDSVVTHASNVKKGWATMDKVATEACFDNDPVFWRGVHNGIEYWITQTPVEAARLAGRHPSKYNIVLSADDVARFMVNSSVVNQKMHASPSDILYARERSETEINLDDEIPF